MLATTTHEFRTPLNGSLSALELLEEHVGEEGKKYLHMARTSNSFLANLMEDILDMARLEQGVFSLNSAPFALGDLADTLADLFMLQTRQKGIYLRFDMDKRTGRQIVNADKKRILQILHNLVSNALKFTSEGGITVGIQTLRSEEEKKNDRVFMEATQHSAINEAFCTPRVETVGDEEQVETKQFLISVADTGAGIGEASIPNLFKLFGKLEENAMQNQLGTGIGLNLC